jgi:hypothetical protein
MSSGPVATAISDRRVCPAEIAAAAALTGCSLSLLVLVCICDVRLCDQRRVVDRLQDDLTHTGDESSASKKASTISSSVAAPTSFMGAVSPSDQARGACSPCEEGIAPRSDRSKR